MRLVAVSAAILLLLMAATTTRGKIDAGQFRADLAALTSSPSRVLGTPGYEKAVEYLRSQIQALGPAVELREQEFPAIAPVTHSATLSLPGGRTEPVYPFWPAQVRVCATPREGITGKLVYAGECRFDQIKPASVYGQIAVIEASAGRRWRQAFYYGARAALVLGAPQTTWRDLSDHDLRIPVNVPRFYVPPGKLADELRRSAITGEATLKANVTWRRMTARNFFALVRPSASDRSTVGRAPAALMISVPFDSMGLVPDLSPGASEAVQTACGLALLRDIATHPWDRPVVIFFHSADGMSFGGTRQMFLALAEAPATWRDEIASVDDEVADCQRDLDRAQQMRDRPQSLDARRDRSLLDRIVKLIDTDLALEQDQLFRVRSADIHELEQKRLESRQAFLNQLRFQFQREPSTLADHLDDARAYIAKQIEQLHTLIEQLDARKRELTGRIDRCHWLARAIGRNAEPDRSATDQRLIELLVGLDLSDRGIRVGPAFAGNFNRASSITQIQDYRDWFARAADAFAANDPGFRWWGDVRRWIDLEPFAQSRTPQTYLCAPIAEPTELAQAWATPGFTLATLDDLRLHRDTPTDTLDNVNVDALLPQLRAVRELLVHAWNDPTFRGPVELKRAEMTLAGQVVSAAPGRPVPDLPRPGFLATYYNVSNKDRRIPVLRWLPPMLGMRRAEVVDCDVLGRYRFEGIPRMPIDPKQPTEPQYVAVNVYRIDRDGGAITATTDLGNQGGDIKWWADIRQDLPPMRSLVFDCEEFSLTGLYDPRFLQSLTDVIPLDARRNAEPQRYGMWLFDEMLSGFVEPGARLYLPIRYGRVGNRMLLINTHGAFPPLPLGEGRGEGVFVLRNASDGEHPLTLTLSQRERGPEGFTAAELNRLVPPSLATARDFYNLDDARLVQYRNAGVSSALVDDLHGTAHEQLDRAADALRTDAGVAFARESSGAWANEARVYDAAQALARDVVRGAIFLLLLCVPFAFVIERLVIATPNVYRQITGMSVIFLLMTLALRSFHPAFRISTSPLIIVLAFAIVTMSAGVIYVVYGRFDAELKRIRSGKGAPAETTLARASVMMSAVMLGIANMRRRRFRTALTSITIVLITFALLCFTGATSYVGTMELPAGVATSHAGILLRQRGFRPIPEQLVDDLKAVLADPKLSAGDTTVVERWWNVFPGDPRQQTDLVVAPRRAAEPPRVAAAQAVLGLSPGEQRISAIAEAIGASKFARLLNGERNIIFLPRTLAEQLGVREGDSLRVGGIDVQVAGVFDPDVFDRDVRMLSGEPITALRYSVGALDTGGRKLEDAQVESLDLSQGVSGAELAGNYEHLSSSQIAIVPAALSKLLPDAGLRSVAIRLKDQDAVKRVSDELARRFAVAIFAGYDDGVRMVAAGNLTQVSGAGQVAIPLVIAGLIIFNTMMGSIAERKREIHVYTSLGLAPFHVGALFLAEAGVYGLIGTVFGYVIGQGLGTAMLRLGWLGNVTLNYSGTAAMLTMGLILLIVLLSALVPARLASQLAAPSIERTWHVPAPRGDVIVAELPFTINQTAADGALAYIAEFFDAHREGSIGQFSAGAVEPFVDGTSRGLATTIWLTPFDLGVRQRLRLTIHPGHQPDIYEVRVELTRLSGDDRNWHRMNKTFLTELRKQFLQWRTLTPERMLEYTEQRKQLNATQRHRDTERFTERVEDGG